MYKPKINQGMGIEPRIDTQCAENACKGQCTNSCANGCSSNCVSSTAMLCAGLEAVIG